MASSTTCPECGKRVSAFAAGCVCGADLEAYARQRRFEQDVDERRRMRWPKLDSPVSRLEGVYLALTLFAVIWLSVLGVVLGLLGVMHGHYEGRRAWMIVCGALAAVALVLELTRL
jgi:uncharacterized membrane protein